MQLTTHVGEIHKLASRIEGAHSQTEIALKNLENGLREQLSAANGALSTLRLQVDEMGVLDHKQ